MNLAQDIMENQRGKGLSFARRIYLPRAIGLGVGFFSVAAALYPLNMPGWLWALLVFNGFVWPHLAYQVSTRSAFPYHAERRNLLYDSLCGGFWTACFQFNPLTTVTILSMMTMNNVAAGGRRLFLLGALAQLAGVLLGCAVFGFKLSLTMTQIQVWACLPMLTLYPLALGMVCYQLAIKLARHKRALSALSRTDSLTGLLNHGAWKDSLHSQFERCQQTQTLGILALIDIDHFKSINDNYGHIIGDAVLRHLAHELKHLAEGEPAGRYGGDEFCVILPDQPLYKAEERMEQLRLALHQYRHPDVPQLRISLSIGLARFQPGYSDAIAWLDDTDKALYTAKHTGRNTISVALGRPSSNDASQFSL
ncbi:diguanylate cyclase [Pseudomonas sp. HMWF021]|uniref:diguanylate cyclase n=1 Tax=Pseudomonas sp. HMWF021 TaxID=2056857 RepID=UPI002691C28C